MLVLRPAGLAISSKSNKGSLSNLGLVVLYGLSKHGAFPISLCRISKLITFADDAISPIMKTNIIRETPGLLRVDDVDIQRHTLKMIKQLCRSRACHEY